MTRKLLFIGDAGCDSGFARCTHHILDVLRRTWDVTVLGLNYRGDPHPYPYPIYPCRPGGDPWGIGRLPEMLKLVKPDVVVVQNDPWNFPAYLEHLKNVPVVGAIAVDGKNCQGAGLNPLALAIFWTNFALHEARQGGYAGPAAVVPLGVDLAIYHPMDRREARTFMRFERSTGGVDLAEAFIVGNVNRNQPRKRLDLTIAYFGEWVKTRHTQDAFLFLHVAPTGDLGYDCLQLAQYYGIADRLILSEPAVWHGVSEAALAAAYASFDVQLTTTQGEGFGLTTLEGLACGIPQIVPDWSALGEWTEDAAIKVPCTTQAVTTNNINVIGGIADREATIAALDRLYRWPTLREQYRARALELASRPCYRWEAIGQAFAEAMEEALEGAQPAAAGAEA